MKLSAGKMWGMRRLADAGGRWKMTAIDQRTPLFGPIMEKRGVKEAPFDDVAKVKEILARHLAPKSSALLIDPLYAYTRIVPHVPTRCGLVLSLEHSVTEETPGGRKSRNIPGWSVPKIRRIGGDAVKVLVWHRADAAPEIKAHQQAFVRAAGEACARADIVFLLEILVYPLRDDDPTEVMERRPERVMAALADYLDPAYQVDIYKLEPPSAIAAVPDPDGPEAKAVQALYDAMAKEVPRPWVLLSAGAGAEDFLRSLTYAYRAGASGYLCGRAIWWEAFKRFPDFAAMEQAVIADAVPYMDRINAVTDLMARPWTEHPGWGGAVTIDGDGPGFPERYPEA